MNTSPALDEAIIDTELRHIKFFNGRLLTGGDLEAEQSAQHAHSRHLGEAIGAGVAFGLEVTPADTSPPDDPIVNITAGLAVNRAGQTLRLQCDQRVALLRPPDPANADTCIFNDCDPKAAGTTLASGTGFYVLLIAPASRSEGKTKVSGLGNDAALCNSQFNSEGVKFRLLRLNVAAGANASQVRNAVAYQCFGLRETSANDFAQGALTRTPPSRRGIEALVPSGYLTTGDVPLAIIEWKAGGIGFVDQWPARRRISRPAASVLWDPLLGDNRLAEGEAMLAQFQDQIGDLRAVVNADRTRAVEHFRYLPPVGIVPLANNRFANGFHDELFFDTITRHPLVHIEGARLEALLRAALHYPPVDLNSRVMLWVYRVRENEQAVTKANTPPFVQPHMIFTTGHMAFMGDPHYDVNRWDFSNWA
ncbi:MAG TPA: hypothetical protein VEX43_01965 [Chthoniobacterales bacterium]|nr:hypothetical protein [Chthoniobacterales bacterium]